jgi:hypothetical protein
MSGQVVLVGEPLFRRTVFCLAVFPASDICPLRVDKCSWAIRGRHVPGTCGLQASPASLTIHIQGQKESNEDKYVRWKASIHGLSDILLHEDRSIQVIRRVGLCRRIIVLHDLDH